MPDQRRRPQPEPLDLHVVYEDEWVMALDKPAGMVVHPTYRNSSGTLLNGVLWHVRDRVDASPGILTRLDKDTSGLVVIGLTSSVHAAMQRDGAAGRLQKEYLAVVRGVPEPPEGRITLPLGRDTADRRVVVVRDDGQQCETRYRTIGGTDQGSAIGTLSLLSCEPVTGRTHQIRVHLAASGWPIVGDRVYGLADPLMVRQALHAWKVALPHPATRQRLEFEAPVPEDLRVLCQNFTL
jgi:RluA family pseudouridine synthase